MKAALALFIMVIVFHNSYSQQIPLGKLKPIIGNWEGVAKRYNPRDSIQKIEIESIHASCKAILDSTYIECTTVWKSNNGSKRNLNIYFNYNSRQDLYDILFLYDNWPGKVNYPLKYSEADNTFKGRDDFIAKGGIQAEEKVSWQILDNGNRIISIENNHFNNEEENYWPKVFEFEWNRIDP